MKIRVIDAIGFFDRGGYIDLETEQYIEPKWFSDRHATFNTGLSAEDYEKMDTNPNRYLKSPVFRCTGLNCIIAMELGMTREQLVDLGFDKDEYFDIFYSNEEGIKVRQNGFSAAEIDANNALHEYIEDNGQYMSHLQKRLELENSIMKSWFSEHGIEVY